MGVEISVIIEGVGLDIFWDVGVKGKGRFVKIDDNEVEFGLLVEGVVEVVEKGRLVKGVEVEANVLWEVGVVRGVDVVWGVGVGAVEGFGSGIRLEKIEGIGVDVVLWIEVIGVVDSDGVLIIVGFGVDGWGVWMVAEICFGNIGRIVFGIFILEMVVVVDVVGWYIVLIGDVVGTGVVVGVEGLESWGEKSWFVGVENVVGGKRGKSWLLCWNVKF